MNNPCISVKNLIFEYPNLRALDNISFEIPAGSVTALVGPNGSGKTTLLRCLAALDTPFSGEILVNNINTQDDPRLCHRQIGYLSDFFGLYDELTGRQCLEHNATIHQLSAEATTSRIIELNQLLSFDSFLDLRTGNLSRGQRQKIGIAQALLHDPQIIFLDEPAAGLDPEARIELSGTINALAKLGKTILVSSHILSELQDYSTHILTISKGRIIGQEKLNLQSHPGHRALKIVLQSDWKLHFDKISSYPELENVQISERELTCLFRGLESEVPAFVQKLSALNIGLTYISPLETNLQELYLEQIKRVK